ncbi:type II toxin-antitoxin system VapB family antitoxin [Janibacter indicus]|uniref:Type II toxin-antitoxin system VapB family antitoxin n=1 Tax=Janibacter indicus TaxID=857417 RepID=A0A7L9IZJ3_9MICO|nr:type II toxin-antitoxin system VapB family antitoxin [Janibacter indicus]QOK22821.1 type II toxin-antitoxin system VapB family antitoxin [Janibacter indicus]
MGLNIKNQRVHDLAREVAQRTGTTQTSAIEEALQRRLEALRAADGDEARRRRLLRLMDEIESDTTDADRARTAQVQEELYDDRGLPA